MRVLFPILLSIGSTLVACGGSAAVDVQVKTGGSEVAPVKPEIAAVGPVDGVACVGAVNAVPEGAKEVSDEGFAKSAIDETTKGKLCMARVYEAIAPIKVYRVWNSQKSYTEFGKWWSFDKPAGPVDAYREQNAICPEWSDLDRVSVCEIKVGARFAVGPGQSAKCATTTYEKSAVNQVFIPNDTREQKVFVDHCEQLGNFP
ncbi:MAG TPA: hypothetical protein PKA58_10115 [Polyangium sp.]|nr:hypothetical protein [Polyangium sp.]